MYIGIGVRVTGDIQINHKDINAPLEKEYRKFEQEPMITQLWSDPNPKPTHDDMMQMLAEIFGLQSSWWSWRLFSLRENNEFSWRSQKIRGWINEIEKSKTAEGIVKIKIFLKRKIVMRIKYLMKQLAN